MSKSRFLSTAFMVATIRQVAGTRIGSVSSGRLHAVGNDADGDDLPRTSVGSTTADPDSTVNSWPNARSKLERFISSTTSHLPVWIASTNSPGRKIRPSGVGCSPPMVSKVVHSEVAVVGW